MHGVVRNGQVQQYVTTLVNHTPRKMSFKRIFFLITFGFALIVLLWLAFIRNVTFSHNPIVDEQIYVGVNDAQLSEKWNHEPELDLQDDGLFHVVTNIILVTHKHYNVDIYYDNTRIPDSNQLEDRQHEIDTTLQSNLNNKHVAAVHVLYHHPAVSLHLLRLKLTNSKKLVLHLTRRNPTVGVNLDYIQKYLKHKPVILMHMDNFLGEGFEDIDLTLMRTQRLMYALTRHSITEKYPCNAALSASCNLGSTYLGSHDAFVFFADKDFDKDMLKELDVGPNSNGIENVMIWYFREKMNYKVLNPCLHLKVYHNHCVPIRNTGKKRFNRKGKNGLAAFSRDLF